MKKFSLLEKVCFIVGFFGVIGSIIVSVFSHKEYFWQVMTLFWMGSAFISELRIKNLEDKL